MKRILAILLCLVTVLSLAACGKKTETPATTQAAAAAPTQPAVQELGPEVVEKKDFSNLAGVVDDATTWYENFMALPIASADMTEDELRQLCADTFKANMSFTWTPNKPFAYTYELLDRYHDVSLPYGIAYSGLCYATGIDYATCGNIWKILPFYDFETGVLDLDAMGDEVNILNNISSACSYGAIQAWNRISNSHNLSGMNSYNKNDAGIIPVGPYEYEVHTYNYNFGSRTASNEIIEANGEKVMFESYAQMKVADGVYSSSSWHVMMISQTPVIVYLSDGSINPYESYVYVHEQGGARPETTQPSGKTIRPLGTIDNKYTFYQLMEKGYIPFTIKEFIGEDPVEPGEAWLGSQTEKLENGKALALSELFSQTLYANYNICNLKVEVKAPDGTVLVSYYPTVLTKPTPKFYSYSLMGLQQTDRIAPYANGKNTIHIYAQLANGELIEAYKTTLKM